MKSHYCGYTVNKPLLTYYLLTYEVKKQSFEFGGNRTHDLRIRSTVTTPTELRGRKEKVGDFPLLGLTPSGLFMGSISNLIYTSELILCCTIK